MTRPARLWTIYYPGEDGYLAEMKCDPQVCKALGHAPGSSVTAKRADLIMDAHAVLDQAECWLRDFNTRDDAPPSCIW